VLRERKRAQSTVAMASGSSSRSQESSRNVPRDRNFRRCWNCGRAGHLRRNCRRQPPVGKRAGARRSIGPRAAAVGAFRKVVANPPATLFWIGMKLKTGNVPALVETGAQFSCLRSDVDEYLNKRGEMCTFSPCIFVFAGTVY
jgi:hypothetical protein